MISCVISGITFLSLFILISLPRSLSILLLYSILLLPNILYILELTMYTLHLRCAKNPQKTHIIFIYPRWHPSSYPHQELVTSGSLANQTGADENLGALAQAFSLAEHTTLPFDSTVTVCCRHEGILQACLLSNSARAQAALLLPLLSMIVNEPHHRSYYCNIWHLLSTQ